jgi:hypothetical protein
MIALSGVRSSCDMLARNSDLWLVRALELPALVLDLVEQPHVLERDRRLIAERSQQRDLLVAERTDLVRGATGSSRTACLRESAESRRTVRWPRRSAISVLNGKSSRAARRSGT